MKHIKILTLVAILFSLFHTKLQAQSVNGTTTVCVGETEMYELIGASSGINYSWTISPSGSGVIANVQNFNKAFIQWNSTGTYLITASDGSNNYSLYVNVYQTQKPYITYDNEVGCQKLYFENHVQTQIIEETDYINVCENSEVLYTVHGTLFGIPPSINFSNFNWTVAGGQIIEVDGTPISPTNSVTGGGVFTGTISTVLVKWGSLGTGYLEVTELTPYAYPNYQNPTNCKPQKGSLSFKIIGSPTADFLVDDLVQLPKPCYRVCLNTEVHFFNKSTSGVGSDIITWEWDFGDGSAVSHQQNPTHAYQNAGNYTVKLKVTNKCGCNDVLEYCIQVEDLPSFSIECPSVVCEGEKTKYKMIAPPCSQYTWIVTGGTIVQQNDPEVIIHWNNVGPEGFGFLGLDGSYCSGACNNITKIKVPVILAHGTIMGPSNTCTNTEYYFELPPWPATNFHWTITNNTNGATFGSFNENSHKVSIFTGSTEGVFTLKCTYENTISKYFNCGGSASFTVNVKNKAIINAPELACINQALSASLTNYAFLTGTTLWRVKDVQGNVLWTGSSANQNISIPGSVFNQAGDYFLFASNPASFCDPDFVKVSVRNTPPTPTAIVGEEYICPSYPYTYSVDFEENTVVHWTASNGSILGGVPYGNTINASWLAANPKSITAYREWEDLPGCISSGFSKSINNIVITGNIAGPNAVVEDNIETYTVNIANNVIAEHIEWFISPQEFAGVATGQGTTSVTVNFLNHPYNSLSMVLECRVTKCGTIVTFILPITVSSTTQITSLSGPTSLCSGSIATWTVNTTGAPPSAIEWDFGDGTVIPQNATGQPIVSASHSYSNLTNNNKIFTITVSAYCGSSSTPSSVFTQNISVNPQPNIGLSPANVEIYCQNMPSYVVIVSNNSIGSFAYQWYFHATNTSLPLPIIGATGISYTINATPPITNPVSTTSDGEYWCEVTNTVTGCFSKSNVKLVTEDCGNGSAGCTPMPPDGISNFITTYSCDQIQANCSTLGTLGYNISSFSWSVNGPGAYTTSGSASLTQSYVYTVNKAGIYKISLTVNYLDNNNPASICPVSKDGYVPVPLIADFLKAITCNASGNSYDLQCTDHSSVFPANTTLSYVWKVNNVVVSTGSSFILPALAPNSVQNIELTVSDGSNFCSKTMQIIIPPLPTADFSALTSYTGNPSNPYKTCEGREIFLTNLSTPAADIKFYNWTFNDLSHSTQKDPVKVYSSNGIASINKFITLKATNNYGCFAQVTKTVQVFKNNISYIINPPYTPATTDYCFGNALPVAITPLFSSSNNAPFTYQWYKETQALPGQVGATLTGTPSLPGSGAYWVMVTNTHNCYKAINPQPALITAQHPPTAFINGKTDVCEGEVVTLTAVTGMPASAGLTYEWSYFDGNTWTVSPQNTKKYIFQHIPGTYTFILKVGGFSNCPQVVSSPFILTVHPKPSAPSVTMNFLDCEEYKIQLSASSSVNPSPLFNWSNGASGQTTYVYNGGKYRLWITDKYACRNYTDVDVPPSPDIYFWRFPTGCYTFCPEDLPKKVDGPWWVDFDFWAWKKDNAVITLNGVYNGYGATSPCDPLIIDQNPPAEGEGEYNWSLDNGWCKKLSGYMNIGFERCCKVDVHLKYIRCLKPLCSGNYYYYELNISNVACPNAVYSISGTDQNGLPLTSLTATPALLNQGTTNISGNFYADPNATDITFYVTVFCNEVCSGKLQVTLPQCPRNVSPQNTALLPDSTNGLNSYLKLLPNPASHEVTVFYKTYSAINAYTSLNIRILDVFGKTISSLPLKASEGSVQLPLESYRQGIYFIELLQNNKRLNIEKLIILSL